MAPCDSCSALAESSWLPAETFCGRSQGIGDDAAQLLHHALQREAERVLVRQRFGLDGQVALAIWLASAAVREIDRHRVQRLDEISDLVIAGDSILLAEIADRHRVARGSPRCKRTADVHRHPVAAHHGDDRAIKSATAAISAAPAPSDA